MRFLQSNASLKGIPEEIRIEKGRFTFQCSGTNSIVNVFVTVR